jgi:hypothetical protein
MIYPEFLHDVLYEAAKTYLATRSRVFRVMPIGAIGSAARVQQDAEILAEDKLLVAIANYEAALPGQSGGGRL